MHVLTLLNSEFDALGFHRKPALRLASELGAHLVLAVGGAVAFAMVAGPAAKSACLLLMTLGNLGITTHTHSSSHNATSSRLLVNRALTYFGYGIMFGTSSTWWRDKHIAVHHVTPNVIGLDDDVDLLPWFAVTAEEFNSGSRLRRLYHRWQWVLLVPAVAFTAFNMMRASWAYLFAALRDPHRRRPAHFVDATVLLAHYVVWLVLPLILFAPAGVLGFYLARGALLGYAVFVTSLPAHFPAEARFLSLEGHSTRGEYRQHSDYVLLQTATTVNYRAGFIGEWLCSGIQYQIEHHLFPGISHVHYPKMSPVLRQFCEENGYPYRTLGWGEGLWKGMMVFKNPKPVEPALEAIRMRAAAEPIPATAHG